MCIYMRYKIQTIKKELPNLKGEGREKLLVRSGFHFSSCRGGGTEAGKQAGSCQMDTQVCGLCVLVTSC